MRYAKYTYPVVKLNKEDVDKVNSCLLNGMTEALTFRTPTRMARTIRKWRRHLQETGNLANIVPPKVMPTVYRPGPGIKGFVQYLSSISAHFDATKLVPGWYRYDQRWQS